MVYKVHTLRFIESPDCPLVSQIKDGMVTVHGRKASVRNRNIAKGDKILFQVYEHTVNTTIIEVEVVDIREYGDVDEFVHGEGLDAILGDRTKCMNIKTESDYAEYYSKLVDTDEILELKRSQGIGFLGFHIRFIHEYQILTKYVQEPWFSHIKSGAKKVEGRLNKSWVSTLQKLDRIVWSYEDSHFSTIVEDIKHYGSFKEMLEQEGIENVLPGVDTIEAGVQVYRQFYSEEDEKKFGVVGIHLRVLKN
jgi:ASC-1-like (ASCH) protein